jgi:hypothetical protein
MRIDKLNWLNVVGMEFELFGGFIVFLTTFSALKYTAIALGIGLFIKVAVILNTNRRRK